MVGGSKGERLACAGDTFDEAHAHARELEAEKALTFIHPYDDPEVIAGQGTIGMEILRQHPKPIHAVFCCVGGGGLLAGTLQGAAMGREVIDFNKDSVTKTNTGQAILVIDLKAFGDPAEFKARVDTLVRDLRNGERLEGVDRIWSSDDPDAERALHLIKDLLARVFPKERAITQAEALAVLERASKAVYVHSHMDEETFDTERIVQCCDSNCYADGTTIPVCTYNILYREKEPHFMLQPAVWNQRSGGQRQCGGSAEKAVPASICHTGSPTAGSYTHQQILHSRRASSGTRVRSPR